MIIADRDDHASQMPTLWRAPCVLWVFHNYDNRWCVHLEGCNDAKAYGRRDEAIDAARRYGRGQGSYRLYLQLPDGRMTRELFNLGAEPGPSPTTAASWDAGERRILRELR